MRASASGRASSPRATPSSCTRGGSPPSGSRLIGALEERDAGIAPEVYAYWRGRAERRDRLWQAVENEQDHGDRDGSRRTRFPPPLRVPWEFMFTFQWAVASMRERYTCAALEPAVRRLREELATTARRRRTAGSCAAQV